MILDISVVDGINAGFGVRGGRFALLESVFVCEDVQRRVLRELFADYWVGSATGAPQSDARRGSRANGDCFMGGVCRAGSTSASDGLVRCHAHGILGFPGALGALSGFLRCGAVILTRGGNLARIERHG